MNTVFNKLSPAEAERLAILSEELGEVQQAIGKILRHGYESTHPNGGSTNRTTLERECGDVWYALQLLAERGDIDLNEVVEWSKEKSNKIGKYLHHNTSDVNIGKVSGHETPSPMLSYIIKHAPRKTLSGKLISEKFWVEFTFFGVETYYLTKRGKVWSVTLDTKIYDEITSPEEISFPSQSQCEEGIKAVLSAELFTVGGTVTAKEGILF